MNGIGHGGPSYMAWSRLDQRGGRFAGCEGYERDRPRRAELHGRGRASVNEVDAELVARV
jgi:hypothetical protein